MELSYKQCQRPLHPTLRAIAGGITSSFYEEHGTVIKWLVVLPAVLALLVWMF